MKTISTASQLRRELDDFVAQGKRIALVPTMGALHEGHLALINRAQEVADITVVSIFVNPTQFGEGEDYDAYPRVEEADLALLKKQGVAVAYTPSVEEMYPHGLQMDGYQPRDADILCGASRPGHFNGVVTVVGILFDHVQPEMAIFGEKDYQQLHIIRQMVVDKGLPVKIIGVPTVREESGLAMSSRNAYLSSAERGLASMVYMVLSALTIHDSPKEAKAILLAMGVHVEYLEVRHPETLQPTDTLPARVFVAANIGKTRLIDNIEVGQ